MKNGEFGNRFHLAIAGSGPLEDRTKKFVRDNGLESIVEFLGPVFGEALNDLLDKTDLLVMPTYHEERLPYAVLEAMAVGIPPITCPKAALARVVNQNVDGLFVDPRDPIGLAHVLSELAGDVARLDRMSFACRRRVGEAYSVSRMAQDFSQLYLRIDRDR